MYAGEKEGEMVIVALLGARSREILWNEAERLETRGLPLLQAMNSRLFILLNRIIRAVQKMKAHQKINKRGPVRVSSKKKINRAKSGKEENAVPAEEGKKLRIKGLRETWRMELRNKKILVFGLAESGAGASNLLAHFGAKVTVTDSKPKEALMKYVEKLLPSVRLSLGGHSDGILQGVDMIVLSPGVPPDIAPLKKAKEMGIRIIGELELAYQIIQGLGVRGQGLAKETTPIPNPQSPIPFLAVTGTNGKSTTTTLLNEMLNKGGFRTILGGNIGNALTEELNKLKVKSAKLKVDFIVAEVSSFQFEAIEMFRPDGASILNITPDHMDRYHSMKKYKDAKGADIRKPEGRRFPCP